jgi:hypothetical protein
MLYTQTGTPFYASPEVWKDQVSLYINFEALRFKSRYLVIRMHRLWISNILHTFLTWKYGWIMSKNYKGLIIKNILGKYNNIDNKVYSNDLN